MTTCKVHSIFSGFWTKYCALAARLRWIARALLSKSRSGRDRQSGKQNRTTDHFERIPSRHRSGKLACELVKKRAHRLSIAIVWALLVPCLLFFRRIGLLPLPAFRRN
jgi:hypothetical protein